MIKTLTFYRPGPLLLLIVLLLSLYACGPRLEPASPETALHNYLHNGDPAPAFEAQGIRSLHGVEVHELLLTSQQWREHTWTHQLTLLVPENNLHDGALLFITGGENMDGLPVKSDSDERFNQTMARLAFKNKAMVAILREVPNQPLYDDLTEDELISFTLHNFRNDFDYTWPLLFPMVKSAVSAMDAIQEYAKKTLDHKVSGFVVSGASKRGWTTWLTGASDPRVRAIAPMVIDVLNMPVSLDYHIEHWGVYSHQIEDYIRLQIPQQVHSDTGKAITAMIDPYSYREKLGMPKMIFIGTNDEYWPVDAIKHYFDDIPGENYIHYVPNAGHDLGGGEQALKALSAFFGRTLTGGNYPPCEWGFSIHPRRFYLTAETSTEDLKGGILWTADSEDRDFRDARWEGQALSQIIPGRFNEAVTLPETGYRALYIDIVFSDPNGGEYSKSTRVFLCDNGGLID